MLRRIRASPDLALVPVVILTSSDDPGDITRGSGTPFYKVDPRSGALVDQKSGRSFNMGDSITVRIANVNLASRQLDLVVEDAASRAGGTLKTLG